MSGRYLTPIQKRLMALEAVVLICCACVEARLVYLQVWKHSDFKHMASHQQYIQKQVEASRGNIEDRNGALLAMNIGLFNVDAHPDQLDDKARDAALLSHALGMPYYSVLSKLSQNRQFVWLARQVPYGYSDAVAALKMDGVDAIREQHRFYPDHEMAAQVLGFTGMDNQGLGGLERYYDGLLTGKNGMMMAQRDARGRLVSSGDESVKAGKDGLNIRTTINQTIQHIAQVELKKAFEHFKCKAASVVVMDPATGEILAMANYPTFDPNSFSLYSPEVWKNRVVNDEFEPGSTFKLVTAVGALEEGVVNEDDKFFCENGAFKTDYGRTVRDHEKLGMLTFREVFGFSSNIGMVKVGYKLGQENLYKYCKKFGFGDPTGIDLPGEATGKVRPLDQWSGLSLTTIPYGYEISTTPIQIVDAYAAIANGGVMMKPYIVKDLEDADGHVVKEFGPRKVRRVCSEKTAERMTQMLRWVVQHGTGTMVNLPTYNIAGKTGTAYKFENGHYSANNYLSSFVGFVPAENPKVVIYVSLDDPRGVYWGGYTAGPVFKEVAKRVMAYDLVPGSYGTGTTNASASAGGLGAGAFPRDQRTVPSFEGLTPEQCKWLAVASGLNLSFTGRGERVVAQSAAPGAPLMAGDQNPDNLVLTLGKPEISSAGGLMPDLRGKTKRQALALVAPLGLKVNFRGEGVVRAQYPTAGRPVNSDMSCEMNCDVPLAGVSKFDGGKS
jgi:cell division protein FtsI/penicillin-binding protein 2